METKCQHIKTDGTKCEAYITNSGIFCFWHDPASEIERKLASQRGGESKQAPEAYGQELNLQTPEDIRLFLGQLINNIWTGKAPMRIAGPLGFLARAWLNSYEVSKMNERLTAIEKKLEALQI